MEQDVFYDADEPSQQTSATNIVKYDQVLSDEFLEDIIFLVENMQCLVKDIRDLVDHAESVSGSSLKMKAGSRALVVDEGNTSSHIMNHVVANRRLFLENSSKNNSLDSEANVIQTPDDSDCSEYWIDYGWSYLQQETGGNRTPTESLDFHDNPSNITEQGDFNANFQNKDSNEVKFSISHDSLMSVDSASSKDEGEFELCNSLLSSVNSSLRSRSPLDEPTTCCQDNHEEYCSVYEKMMEFYLETMDSDGNVSDESNFDDPDVTPRLNNTPSDSFASLVDDIAQAELVFSDISSCASRTSLADMTSPADLDTTLANVDSTSCCSLHCATIAKGDVNPWKNYSVTVNLADTDSESSFDIT